MRISSLQSEDKEIKLGWHIYQDTQSLDRLVQRLHLELTTAFRLPKHLLEDKKDE